MSPFDEMKAWIRWGPDDEARLRALWPAVAPHLPGLTELFYARILEQPGAASVLRDAAQVERLKGTLRRWAEELVRGPWDEAYYTRRERIGRVHVEVGLPARHMVTAMNVFRTGLGRLAAGSMPAEEALLTCESIGRACDMDLAIMTAAYVTTGEERQHLMLRRSESLAQLGALSGAVAHELRNPLAGISGAIQVIARSLPADDRRRPVMDKVELQVRRLDALVAELQEFARPAEARISPVALDEVARPVVELARRDRPDVTITTTGGGRASADPNLVGQILHHLVQNAIQAQSGPGEVRVAISPGRIVVNDAGPGIPPENVERIFEPFFTTRARGTGLGLAICRKSAAAMGGHLTLGSGPLPGAAFELSLPVG